MRRIPNYKLEEVRVGLLDFNLVGAVVAIDMVDSIFSPSGFLEVELLDSQGIYEMLEISGGETISVQWITEQKEVVFWNGKVSDVSVRSRNSEHNQVIVLSCCSSELYQDASTLIDGTYFGSADEIVRTIWLDKAKVQIDAGKTIGKHRITFPGMSLLEATALMSREAQDAEGYSSNFLLYEDREGYHWKSIESMVAADSSIGDVFFKTDLGVLSNEQRLARNVSFFHNPSALTAHEDGFFGSRADMVDLVTKTVSVSRYDYTLRDRAKDRIGSFYMWKDFKHLGTRRHVPVKASPKHPSEASYSLFVGQGKNFSESTYVRNAIGGRASEIRRRPSVLPLSIAELASIQYVRRNVVLDGDMRIRPGQTVTLILPNIAETFVSTEGGTVVEKMQPVEHKLLISSVKHSIFTGGDTITTIETISDVSEHQKQRRSPDEVADDVE